MDDDLSWALATIPREELVRLYQCVLLERWLHPEESTDELCERIIRENFITALTTMVHLRHWAIDPDVKEAALAYYRERDLSRFEDLAFKFCCSDTCSCRRNPGN